MNIRKIPLNQQKCGRCDFDKNNSPLKEEEGEGGTDSSQIYRFGHENMQHISL